MQINELGDTMLFQGMVEEEIRAALHFLASRQGSYEKGEAIFHAGSFTERLGLVLSGSVAIESNDIWGNRMILHLAGAGEFFAETYALLPAAPLMVDAVANERCSILFLGIGRLMGDCTEREGEMKAWKIQLMRNLLRILAQKNLSLSGRSFHTSPKSARGRIMAYLNSEALKQGKQEFDIPFDRQQLADYLNLERTALSKELGRMRNEHILSFRKNHFSLIENA